MFANVKFKNKNNTFPAFRGGVADDEISREILKNGLVIRARRTGDEPATLEFFSVFGGWHVIDAARAADFAVVATKARVFIEKHAPDLLQKED